MRYVLTRFGSRVHPQTSGEIVLTSDSIHDVAHFASLMGSTHRVFAVASDPGNTLAIGKSVSLSEGLLKELEPHEHELLDRQRANSLLIKHGTRSNGGQDKFLESLTFRNAHLATGHHHEVHELYARVNGQPAGVVKYSNEGGRVVVGKIEIQPEFQRKGVGTRILQELQSLHPAKEVELPRHPVDSPVELFIRGLPRVEVQNPDAALIDAEIAQLKGTGISTNEGRIHELEQLRAIYTYQKSGHKILSREELIRYPDNKDAVLAVRRQALSDLSRSQPNVESGSTDVEARKLFVNQTDRIDSLHALRKQITEKHNGLLAAATKARFEELVGKRRKYSYSALKALPQNGADEIFNSQNAALQSELTSLGADDASMEKEREKLLEAGQKAPLMTGSKPVILRTVTSGDYHTQGYGAETYARNRAEMDLLKAQSLGMDARLVSTSKVYDFSRGGKSDRHVSSEYHVVAMVNDVIDREIFTKKPGVPVRETLKMLMKKGSNPRVYFPHLPFGYETELGLDAFGNDLPTADSLAVKIAAKMKEPSISPT